MNPTFPLLISGLFAVSAAALSAFVAMFLQDILSGLSRWMAVLGLVLMCQVVGVAIVGEWLRWQ